MGISHTEGSRREALPDHITDDDRLARQFRVSLATALSNTLGESEWKKIALLHELEPQITDHHRFMRALRFNDPDFEGHVVDLVDYLYGRDQGVLRTLFLRDDVQRWLKRNDEATLKMWEGEGDPLIDALSHGVGELEAAKGSIDLSEYSRRIQEALPSDPKLAVGATKDMLEATMRTILHGRGITDTEKLEFPTLTTRCMHELGLLPTTAPSSKAEGFIRKIASTAKTMIEVANELRNHAGTGHGKVVGEAPPVSLIDAQLVAAEGFILCAWLLRHSQEQSP